MMRWVLSSMFAASLCPWRTLVFRQACVALEAACLLLLVAVAVPAVAARSWQDGWMAAFRLDGRCSGCCCSDDYAADGCGSSVDCCCGSGSHALGLYLHGHGLCHALVPYPQRSHQAVQKQIGFRSLGV